MKMNVQGFDKREWVDGSFPVCFIYFCNHLRVPKLLVCKSIFSHLTTMSLKGESLTYCHIP